MEGEKKYSQIDVWHKLFMKTRLSVVVVLKRRIVREPADPVGTRFNTKLVVS